MNYNQHLTPFPYMMKLRKYLQETEPQMWSWFASDKWLEQSTQQARIELLKTSYRLDPDTHSLAHSLVQDAADSLNIDAPITLYQSQAPSNSNAAISHIPREVHIVCYGPILETLSENEQRALFGHELTHYLLRTDWEGDYLTTERILNACSGELQEPEIHLESARRLRLYAEILCDLGGLRVCDSLDSAVCMLLKVHTETKKVSSEKYLEQAAEILDKGEIRSEELSHPECFIRARSLQLCDQASDQSVVEEEISNMISGPISLDRIDLLDQFEIASLTRQLIDHLMLPTWMQTKATLSHAIQFFNNYSPPSQTEQVDIQMLDTCCSQCDESLKQYFGYVLLDFATTDPDIEEYSFAHALKTATLLGISDQFRSSLSSDMHLTARQVKRIESTSTPKLDSADTLKQ